MSCKLLQVSRITGYTTSLCVETENLFHPSSVEYAVKLLVFMLVPERPPLITYKLLCNYYTTTFFNQRVLLIFAIVCCYSDAKAVLADNGY